MSRKSFVKKFREFRNLASDGIRGCELKRDNSPPKSKDLFVTTSEQQYRYMRVEVSADSCWRLFISLNECLALLTSAPRHQVLLRRSHVRGPYSVL